MNRLASSQNDSTRLYKTMPTTLEWITLCIAAYGAALSTYLGYRHVRTQKPRMSIRYDWERDSNSIPLALKICAANSGNAEIIVKSLRLELPRKMILSPNQCTLHYANGIEDVFATDLNAGKCLKYGEGIDGIYPYSTLRTVLTKRVGALPLRIRVVCEDSLGNRHCGRWFEVE